MIKKSPLYGVTAMVTTAFFISASATVNAETVGFNFQHDAGGGNGGAAVTEPSFGIPVANWFNMPRVQNSLSNAVATSTTLNLPGGGRLLVEWSARNTYRLPGGVPATAGENPSPNQVIYGYLDDSAPGYQVKLSGLRSAASDYKITLIASSDNATGFTTASLTHSSGTDALSYGVPDPGTVVPGPSGGVYALTPPSDVISATDGNDAVTITAAPRSGLTRATMAGIILEYTTSTTNKPLIETQPAAPVGQVFSGDTVTLSASASGGGNLSYQWRKNGSPLAGKTDAILTLAPAAGTDTGVYDLVVTNGSGSSTSNPVNVNITQLLQPAFTTLPLSQNLYDGYPATFTSAATGGELTYSWKKGNDALLPGATDPVLKLASITPSDAGTYTVTARNSVGSASASVVLTVVQPVPGSYEATQASQKPLLWYRYGEMIPLMLNTGTAANSGSVGAAGNGVAKRYLAFQTPGALAGDPGTSAGLKLNNQFIDIPYNEALNPAVFTAELWVKPPPVNNGRIDPLINRGENAGDGFLFFGWNGVTKWQFRCYDGTARTQVNSEVDIVPGQWTHLVGVYDGTAAHLYVNGVEQTTGTEGSYTPNTAMPIRLAGFPNDTGESAPGGGNFAGGAIDEVAIYNTVLTPAQILSHYQNGTDAARSTPYDTLVQASAPKGYWRMDDAAPPAKPAPKNSGTAGVAWTGDYGGDIVPGTDGPVPPEDPGFSADNKAVAMTNGYTNAPPLNINTNTLTVTTWIKRAEIFTTSDLGWPAWLGAGGGFHIDGTAGRPYGELRYHWDGSQWSWGSGLQVPQDIWTFCAMVLEPTKTTIYMGDGDTLRKSIHTAAHSPHLLKDPLSFGGNQTGGTGRNFIGQLDESAFYDRALSETEITSLFVKGSGAPFELSYTPGGALDDTKPQGTPVPALNYGAAILASDGSRQGVAAFPAGTGGKIVIPASPDINSPAGTIMFWLKTALPAGAGSEAAILFDHRTSSGAVLGVNAADGTLFFQSGPSSANSFYGPSVVDEAWHHIAITWNQDAAGSVSMYQDGVLAATQANNAAWTWPAGQPIEIGSSHDSYWQKLAGSMDDFQVYNQELTAAQIDSVFKTGAVPVPAALLGRYDFGSVGNGMTLSWPFGILETSTLQPGDSWVPVVGALSPLPVLTSPEKARFYRATLP